MKTTKTLDDLTPRGADRLIGWIKGTMQDQTAQGRSVRAMVEEFLDYTATYDGARCFEAPRITKPEAAAAVAA